MLTLYYSMMSYATLSFYYRGSMITLQISLPIMCTLVAKGVILGRLECVLILYNPGGCES